MTGPLTRAGRFLRWFGRPFVSQEPSFYRATMACLLASGVFWQMIALNKTYTTRLDCPLHWRYDTARYVALRPLPASVPVVVTGQGWRLLRANLGLGIRPAELRPTPRPGTRYLSPVVWQQGLQTALEGLEVKEWAGDTLRLTFDRLASRLLPLALAGDSAVRYTARFTPDRLLFRGPASVVADLPNPYPVAAPANSEANADDLQLPVTVPALVRAGAATVRVQLVARPASLAHPRRKNRRTS